MNRNNNRYKIAITMLLAMTITFMSCQQKLDDEFLNPNGFTNPTIEGFFADAQQRLGTFRYAYGEMYWAFPVFNRMLGTGGFANDGIQNTPSWNFDLFNNSFDRMRSIVEMNRLYETLSAEEQADYNAYILCGDVIKAYIFYQMTETFNNIPYTEALQGKDNVFFPKYDSQQAIYQDILATLKAASDVFATLELGTSYPEQQFPAHDVLFKGDFQQWRSFVNSLRLRLAIHLTNVEPALAKTTISEVLNEGIYAKDRATSFVLTDEQQDRAQEILIFRSFQEQRGQLWMPQKMLDVLRVPGEPEDPRLKVLFQPDRDGNYTAMPTEGPFDSDFQSQISSGNLSATFPSMYNRATFEQNHRMPYQIITSSEIHLILSEAALRWPELGLNATDEYALAIQQSIDMYYEINGLNERSFPQPAAGIQPDKPAQQEIDNFIVAKRDVFNAAGQTEKLGLIYDQKYVHFNVLKPYELWTETRRLVLELGDRVLKKPSNWVFMERTLYPSSESTNNAENFVEVFDENNYTSPVWFTGR